MFAESNRYKDEHQNEIQSIAAQIGYIKYQYPLKLVFKDESRNGIVFIGKH